jgi:regulatory protein
VAKALWLKKFGQPAQDEKEKAKQVRFLQARGFGFDIIRKIIRGLDE